MPSRHSQRLCLAKNRYWQDELKDKKIVCPRCKQLIDAEDVFDLVPLIDCVSVIKVDPNSKFRWQI